MRQHSVSGHAPGRAAQPGAHAHRVALDLSGASDRQLVADALRALLRERSEALHLATRIAAHHRHPRPDPRDFGLTDILRLARLVEPETADAQDGPALSF